MHFNVDMIMIYQLFEERKLQCGFMGDDVRAVHIHSNTATEHLSQLCAFKLG